MTNEKDNKEIEEIDCTEAIDNLYAYLDGEISDIKIINKLKIRILNFILKKNGEYKHIKP